MIDPVLHLSAAELEAGLGEILRSPADEGTLELIVRRPAVDEREVLDEAQLDPAEGLVGDSWRTRAGSQTEDGALHPETQLNVMNARAIGLIAVALDRWALAGDQLYIDLDLSDVNLPAGTRLVIGEAVIEVTAVPHRGCQKFSQRFGVDALRFVNSPIGRQLHLRGINAKVVLPGTIRRGDVVRKEPEAAVADGDGGRAVRRPVPG